MYTNSSLLLPAERACKYAVNIASSADSSCPPRVDAASALNRSAVACPYNSDCWPSHRAAWYPLHAAAIATIASTATSMISATVSQRALLCCSSSFCSLSLCEISTLWPSGIPTSFRPVHDRAEPPGERARRAALRACQKALLPPPPFASPAMGQICGSEQGGLPV